MSVLFVVFIEGVVICWIFGAERFAQKVGSPSDVLEMRLDAVEISVSCPFHSPSLLQIHQMLGSTPGIYWRLCWTFISPVFLFVSCVTRCSFYGPVLKASKMISHHCLGSKTDRDPCSSDCAHIRIRKDKIHGFGSDQVPMVVSKGRRCHCAKLYLLGRSLLGCHSHRFDSYSRTNQCFLKKVPLYAIYMFCKSPGTMKQRLETCLKPLEPIANPTQV